MVRFLFDIAFSILSVDALLNLGLLLRKQSKKEESFGFLLQAAELNCARACFLVGRCYESGEGIAQDIEKVRQVYVCFQLTV